MKKIPIFIYLVCFFPTIHGMELDTDNQTKTGLVRKDSMEVTIPMSQSDTEKPKITVPALDLSGTVGSSGVQGQVTSGSDNGSSKQRIASMKDLGRSVSQKPALTSRNASSSGAMQRPIVKRPLFASGFADDAAAPAAHDSKIVQTDSTNATVPQKTQSLLPKILAQSARSAGLNVDDKKVYLNEEVWNLLKAVNPALHAFALKHNLTIPEVEDYAHLMEELDIDPKVITEYVHQSSQQSMPSLFTQVMSYVGGNISKQNLSGLAAKYEEIKQKNPEGYKEIILELMKAASDEAKGQQTRSTIADTHTTLQTQQIDDQSAQIRLQYLGLLVSVITAVGGWVFGIYGQTLNPSNSTGS